MFHKNVQIAWSKKNQWVVPKKKVQTQFYLKVASIIQSFFVSRVIEVTCFLCSTCNWLVITVDKSWIWIDTCCMCGAIKVIICAQVVMLVLAWKLDAQSMGYFTRQEWLRGMGSLQYVTCLSFVILHVFSLSLVHVFQECPSYSVEQSIRVCQRHFSAFVRCDSTERLRNSLDYLRSVLNDSTSFKLIYRYAFDFARVRQAKFFPQRCSHAQKFLTLFAKWALLKFL